MITYTLDLSELFFHLWLMVCRHSMTEDMVNLLFYLNFVFSSIYAMSVCLADAIVD